MILTTLGTAFLYVAGVQPVESRQVPDLQDEIHRAIDAQSETEWETALEALRTSAGDGHRALVLQLFRVLIGSTSTREAMAFGAIREALSIPDTDVINALVPLLESSDEAQLAALRGVLSEFEDHSPGGEPDFSVYLDFLRGGIEQRPGLVRYMTGIDRNAANLTLARARELRNPEPFQLAERPVTDQMLQNPPPSEWLSRRRTLNGWGYTPLDQVDRKNVGDLRMVWTRALAPGSQQGTPLAYGGVLYVPNPNDVVQAIDAVTGDLLWEYRRDLPDGIDDNIRGRVTGNHNIAIHGTRVINTSSDDYIYALDGRNGELIWETELLNYNMNPTRHSTASIVADGKVFLVRSCQLGPAPETCVVEAHDAETGEELWRRELVQNARESRIHASAPVAGVTGSLGDLGSWMGSWTAPSVDPELNLVFIGTSVNSSMVPRDIYPLYNNSTLALDADTGDIVWDYQHVNGRRDHDHPLERLLVDTAVAPDPTAVSWINPQLTAGERRRVVTGIPDSTGIVYTLDRETGELLWATPTVPQNVIADNVIGMVTPNEEIAFNSWGQEVLSCPSGFGNTDREAGAYSPLTNTMYMPLRNVCDAPVVRNRIAPGTDRVGIVQAISAETGETRWIHEQRSATMSLMTTGGRLLFGGDANGRFRAFDQDTGEVLWEINLGSAVTGFPISYEVDGRQYVAVSTGSVNTTSSPFVELTPSLVQLTPQLQPSDGNNLFVFRLP